ncbi:MAG: carboxypeptidase regulatory-like domain-containing protein [Acidobacteriaceae bacterium]|nr:carboxypeptidase regulatory-like domain-containing protein [Acidobacteriaceae bacterium]
MQNKPHEGRNLPLKALSKFIHILVLISVSGIVLVASVSAQSTVGANPNLGTVLGRVLDVNEDPVANATVVLQRPAGDHVAAVTVDDGSFALHDLTPGIAYGISVTAPGYGEWSSSVTVEPGEDKTLTDIKLRIVASYRAVTVTYSSKEVAAQQLKAEEHQRVLGFIPNIYVTYEAHPEPLTTGMKFHLAYKGLTHPTFFAFEGFWAGVEQAGHITDYRQGARGYGERFGANLASGTSEALFGNAILPALLHQDPRYFYRGSGAKGSRAWHAIIAPFVCQGDNGKSQPNYSQMGGSLISASLSNTYYPDSERGAGLVFRNFGTSMGLHVALGLAQEFLLGKFTSRGRH